eukprot:TRINITY_DN4859_c0_g2_i1.p1 TRINITY_DN4859_c0_g2~~TRINITY_DN4859_c0_g2_i1.p1  ORF type:complete len:416 (+),score=70.79 TRINITY_DN4859_c0_g2_i1:48-1250(+)
MEATVMVREFGHVGLVAVSPGDHVLCHMPPTTASAEETVAVFEVEAVVVLAGASQCCCCLSNVGGGQVHFVGRRFYTRDNVVALLGRARCDAEGVKEDGVFISGDRTLLLLSSVIKKCTVYSTDERQHSHSIKHLPVMQICGGLDTFLKKLYDPYQFNIEPTQNLHFEMNDCAFATPKVFGDPTRIVKINYIKDETVSVLLFFRPKEVLSRVLCSKTEEGTTELFGSNCEELLHIKQLTEKCLVLHISEVGKTVNTGTSLQFFWQFVYDPSSFSLMKPVITNTVTTTVSITTTLTTTITTTTTGTPAVSAITNVSAATSVTPSTPTVTNPAITAPIITTPPPTKKARIGGPFPLPDGWTCEKRPYGSKKKYYLRIQSTCGKAFASWATARAFLESQNKDQ